MKIQNDGEPAVADRFDQIEAILQRYPDIDDGELADLKRWFGKEASSFEVASLASKDSVNPQYGEFRPADSLGDRRGCRCGYRPAGRLRCSRLRLMEPLAGGMHAHPPAIYPLAIVLGQRVSIGRHRPRSKSSRSPGPGHSQHA